MLDQQIDLVHGFTIKCAVYGSIAAWFAGISAHVNAVTGMGYVFSSEDAKARLLRPIVRTLLRLALGGRQSRLILQNPDDVGLFQRSGLVAQDQIRLILGSGVDCQRFMPKLHHPEGSADKPFQVLLPPRLLWDKGIAEYVEAARILRGEGRAIEFLLAGDPDPGNPATVPETMIHDCVSEGLLTWLGHVDDMPALYKSVDTVVLPSYREGLPKGLIEAGACGLPLITTDVPGSREAVTDEIDGLLVPVKDPLALAQAIARLADDPALRHRLGHAARAKALSEFDERIVIKRTLAVYEELLGKNPA